MSDSTNASETPTHNSGTASNSASSGSVMLASESGTAMTAQGWNWWNSWGTLIAFVTLIGAGAWASEIMTGSKPGVRGVWLPAGIIAAGVWYWGERVLPSVIIGLWMAWPWQPLSIVPRLLLVAVETGTWYWGIWLLRRLIGVQPPWQRVLPTISWIGVTTGLCPLVIGVGGGAILWWFVPDLRGHFAELCAARVLSQATGAILASPVGLAYWPWRSIEWTRKKTLELVALTLSMALFAYWTFGPRSILQEIPIPDIAFVIPLYVWSLMRFGRRGISAAMLILGFVSLYSSKLGFGPFIRTGGELISWSVLLAEGNVCVLHATILMMTALWIERSFAERDALKADARFRILFERSPDAAFVVDLRTNELLEFNDRLPELLKYTPEQLRKQAHFDFEIEKTLVADRSSLISTVHPRTIEMDSRFRCRDGEFVDVRLTSSVVDVFGRKVILMLARDITNRLKSEQQLRDSEERFRMLAQHIPAIVAIQNGASLTYVNRAAIDMLGFSEKELMSKGVVQCLRSEYRPQIQKDLDQAIGQRQAVRREVDLQNKDGQVRRIDLSLVPMTQAGRAVWLVCGVDVTDQRDAESAIRQLNAELFHAARLRLLGEMAAGIIHDIGHPLASISNLASASLKELGEGRTLSVDSTGNALTLIQASVENALARVERLRNLSRRQESSRRRMRILDAVTDAAQLVRLNQDWAEVPIGWTVEAEHPRVFADRAAITQVLLDLFRNGLEAMRDTPDRERRLHVTISSPDASHVQVSVRDWGSGIPEEFRSRLFKAFESTKSEGMGLGLSLCKTVIEQHEGKLWHEPATPSGSIFHFTLPARNSTIEAK